jgi:hypothetical protein
LTNITELIRYLRRNSDLSRVDATSRSYLGAWLAEGLAQLERDAIVTAGYDAEMDAEIAEQTAELRAAVRRLDALIH